MTARDWVTAAADVAKGLGECVVDTARILAGKEPTGVVYTDQTVTEVDADRHPDNS